MSADEKAAIDTAIDALEKATKENDVDDIKAKIQAVQDAAMPVLQRMYSQEGGATGAEGMDPSQFTNAAGGAGQAKPADDGVVDAEFTEVNDKK